MRQSLARLLAAGEDRQQVVAALDRAGWRSSVRRSSGALSARKAAPAFRLMASALAPVAGDRHLGSERGQRGGFGAEDARAERDRRSAFGAARIAARSSSVKPPSGPVRISRRAGLERATPPARRRLRRRNRACARVALSRNASSGTGSSISGRRVRPHCSAASIAIASQPVELEPLDDRPLGHHRDQPRDAQLGRFLDQPVGLRRA